MSDEATVRMVATYRAKRRLKVGKNLWREPGELFPESHAVRIQESWVTLGRVEPTTVPVEEFVAFVHEHVNEGYHERIFARTGLSSELASRGPLHAVGPKVPTKEVPAEPPGNSDEPKRVRGPRTTPAKRVPQKRVPKGEVRSGSGDPTARKRVSRAAEKHPVDTAPKAAPRKAPAEKAVRRRVQGGIDVPMRSLLDED